MPVDPSAVYQTVHFGIGAVGLLAIAVYWFLPRLQPLRRGATSAPSWTTPLADSLLMFGAVCGAVFFGMVAGAAVGGALAGGNPASALIRQAAANFGMFTAVPLGVWLAVRYIRSAGTPVAPARAPGAPTPLEGIAYGTLTFLIAHPLAIAAGIGWQHLLVKLNVPIESQPVVQLLAADSPPLARVTFVAVAVIFAPIAEELCFRVGLFRLLGRWLPRWAALALSAAAFAALHFNLAGAPSLFVLGIVWAHAYDRTGTPVVNIVAHGLWNLTTVALVLGGWAPVTP